MNDDSQEPQDNDSVEELVEKLQHEVEEWKDLATRRAADYANLQRRSSLERMDLIMNASETQITRMLPILDDLHAAVESARFSTETSSLQTGIEMIYAKALKIFEEAGIQIIEAGPGQVFNVEYHEALMHTSSEHPEGHIVQNVLRGYQLREKVLRHAKVITSAGLPPHIDKAKD